MTDIQQTEHKIIHAAKQVFVEKGLEGTKMVDIAERAGISRTALNYYYRTKENLFYAIIEEVFDLLLPEIESLSLFEGDLASKIDGLVDIYDHVLRRNECMPRFVFTEIQRNPSLVHDFVTRSGKAQMYLSALGVLLDNWASCRENNGKGSKEHFVTVFFGLLFVPYLFEPLITIYHQADEVERENFLAEHKVIVKKLLKAYFD